MAILRDLRDSISRRMNKSKDNQTNPEEIDQKEQTTTDITSDSKDLKETSINPSDYVPNESNVAVPRDLGPSPPGHQMQSQLQNTGMQIGVADSMLNSNGPNMGTGIVDGMVVGGIVGQRIDQARNHAYWKNRQQEFLAGNEAAVVNPGVPKTAREERREERRKNRWSRRAN